MSKTPIHFMSLFGVDFDTDLAPFWARHYTDYGFDSYHVFLHSGEGNEDRINLVGEIMHKHGITTENVTGEFKEGRLRVKHLKPYKQSLPHNDYIVVADSDEFHDFEANEYVDIIREHDSIEGKLIDRWGDKLTLADPRFTLDEQYPRRGRFVKKICREKHVPIMNLTGYKYMAVRAGYPHAFVGSHNCTLPKNAKRLLGRNVWHYTWRPSILMRMLDKRYFSPALVWYIGEHFGVDRNDPRMVNIMEVGEQLQRSMGWEPAPYMIYTQRRADASQLAQEKDYT